MKRLSIFLASMALAVSTQAQNSQGIIRYTAVLDFSEFHAQLNDPGTNLDQKKKIEEYIPRLKRAEEHTYVLTFDKHESVYSREEKLGLNDHGAGPLGGGDYYKNIKDNLYIREVDAMGTMYHISEPLPKFDWKLSDDTKTIGEYICYKAVHIERTEGRGMKVGPDGGMEQVVTVDSTIITAWYCPDIPIMHGPGQFGGLPGLILELTTRAELANIPLTLHCTEIALNPAKKVTVRRPRAKKLYTPMEFQLEMMRLQGVR